MAADRYCSVGIEDNYAGDVAAQRFIRMIDGDLPGVPNYIRRPTVARRHHGRSVLGSWKNDGGWSQLVSPENIGEVLYCLVGPPVTTQPDAGNSPSVYDHVFTPINTGRLKTITTRMGRDIGEDRYPGTIIKDTEFSSKVDDIVDARIGALAQKVIEQNALATPMWQPEDWLGFLKQSVTYAGAPLDWLNAFTFKIENSQVCKPHIGNRFAARNVTQGLTVGATLDSDLINYNLKEKYLGKAAALSPITDPCELEREELEIILKSCIINPGETTELEGFMKINMPEVILDASADPIEERNEIIQKIDVIPDTEEGTDVPFIITLRNTIAAYTAL